MIRIEEYIKHYLHKRLQTHKPADISSYLTGIGRKNNFPDWQFLQIVAALHLLFHKLLKVPCCEELDWDY